MNDLKFAFRQLSKNPGFTTVAVLTLALGIGANTAMFSLINGVLVKPLPFPKPERLITLFENHKEQGQDFVGLSAPGFTDWRAQNSVFEEMAAYQGRGFDLTGGNTPLRLFAVRASASLFPMLGVNPALGRGFTVEEDVFGNGRVAVLSHHLWQERFGGAADVLGKSLTLDGNIYSVIGVMPAGFRFSGMNPDLWVPMAFEPFEMENRGGHNFRGLARLKPGVSVARAKTEMDAITARLGQQYELSKGWALTLVPLKDQQVGDVRKPLLLLFGAVGFVLLIACANVGNLLLARAAAREREFAVRAALGAGRGRIIRQLLSESLLLTGAGASAGWLVAAAIVSAMVKFGSLPRIEDVRLDVVVFWFTAILVLVTGVILGFAPAVLASRTSLSEALKDPTRGATQGRRQRFRFGSVVVQVALAIILLVGASLLLRSFSRLCAVDFGYQPERLLTAVVTMPDARFPGKEAQRMTFLAQLLERIAALPGVDSAASVMGLPLSFIGATSAFYIDGMPEPKPNEYLAAGYSQVSTNYFQTMGTPLLRGRRFDSHDTMNSPYVAIINEAFARAFFPDKDPLGKRLRVMDSYRNKPTEIVGVVRDMRQRDLVTAARPEMYFPTMQRCWADAQIVVRTRVDPALMAAILQRTVAEIDSRQTVSFIRTMESLMDNAMSQRRLQMLLLAAFSGVACCLPLSACTE